MSGFRLPLRAAMTVLAVAMIAVPSEASHYYYFKQRVEMPLDDTRIAVRGDALPVEQVAAGLGIAPADVSAWHLPAWSMVSAPPEHRGPGGAALLVAELSGAPGVEFASPVFLDRAGNPKFVTPDILVRFEPGVGAVAAEAILAGTTPGVVRDRDWAGMIGAFRYRCESRDGFDVLAAANELAERPDVAWAEPDFAIMGRGSDVIPNDPDFGDSWGLHNTGQSGGVAELDMDAPDAWDLTTGLAPIWVLVLDVGVDMNHADLNIAAGMDFTEDPDSNGDGGPVNQFDNHGTAVAGCISGIINNGIGTAGISPTCMIASARMAVATDAQAHWSAKNSYTVAALAWAEVLGAQVTNNSNDYGDWSSAIADKYVQLEVGGMIHFASAGNDASNELGFPARVSNVNAISAMDRHGLLAGFSNYHANLFMTGPGVDIWTTDRTGDPGYNINDYVWKNGTSFSSPFAAGVAALVLSIDSSLTPDEVEAIMIQGGEDLGAVGFDIYYGWGMINAYGAMTSVFDTCGAGAGPCNTAHPTPGCSEPGCCTLVCDIDDYCCEVAWDALCVEQAEASCFGACTPNAGDCYVSNGSPGCEKPECCSTVCQDDTFCCDQTWDTLCANLAWDLCPPANDDCGAAPMVFASPVEFDTRGATTDGPAHPSCESNGDAQINQDVWYRYTAPCDGTLIVSTCANANFDTKIAVYMESVPCMPTDEDLFACNDDAEGCPGYTSEVSVPVIAGGIYRVRVGGFLNSTGSGLLSFWCIPLCGDGAGGCFQANGTPGCSDEDCCATVCSADPFCCDFEWDYGCALTALELCWNCGVNPGDCREVHSGPGCNLPSCCAAVCDVDPYCCEGSWDQICVDVANTYCAPINDHCSEAFDVAEGSYEIANYHATLDGPPCEGMGTDIWYRYTAPASGNLTVSTCGYSLNTVIAIFDGCACVPHENNRLGCNDDACGSASELTVPVSAGQCYLVQVGGWGASQGTTTLTITLETTVCPSLGSCCVAHPTPGCDDGTCCDLVCGADPFCCDNSWDSLCVGVAEDLCGDLCPSCAEDIDGDDTVGITDFLALLGVWGPCPDCGNCPADFDGDCTVGVTDFLLLLANWGPCL
jgi:hypothetical protein